MRRQTRAYKGKTFETSDGLRKLRFPELDLAAAKKRVVYWMTRRDYSEKELKTKLEAVTCDAVVEQTINWCHDLDLIVSDERMQELIIQKHARQKSGRMKLNQDLKKRGLKPVETAQDYEFDSALSLVEQKMNRLEKNTAYTEMSYQEKTSTKSKVYRFLLGRGFSMDLVSKAFSTWSKTRLET